jgi:hypothetical protein
LPPKGSRIWLLTFSNTYILTFVFFILCVILSIYYQITLRLFTSNLTTQNAAIAKLDKDRSLVGLLLCCSLLCSIGNPCTGSGQNYESGNCDLNNVVQFDRYPFTRPLGQATYYSSKWPSPTIPKRSSKRGKPP